MARNPSDGSFWVRLCISAGTLMCGPERRAQKHALGLDPWVCAVLRLKRRNQQEREHRK